MTRHPYVIVDVFTDTPLAGNALAVFPDPGGVPEAVMGRLARELNLSETVFALAPAAGGDVAVRIFTPNAELPFAGHPLLGSAFVLAGPREVVRLETGRGVVPVALERRDGAIVFGRMIQPMPEIGPYDQAPALLAALGVERAELPIETYVNGPINVYVALADESSVAALRPDFGALTVLGGNISCFAGTGTRYTTRVFGPALGVFEDPATGSAAGPLALHLARHGRIAFGEEIEIRQGAEIGRPSVLHARIDGSVDAVERIEVGGAAVIVGHGEFEF